MIQPAASPEKVAIDGTIALDRSQHADTALPTLDLLQRRLRANPRYELVLLDRLPSSQRQLLGDLDPTAVYGILRPRVESGLCVKTLCHRTALLFLTLREPGALPGYVRDAHGERTGDVIRRLILDEVIEVEVGAAFVSGAASSSFLGGLPSGADAGAPNRLSALSLAALRYGQSLAIDEAMRLSARLYFFNRQPLAPALRARYGSRSAVEEFIGLKARLGRGLRREWKEIESGAGPDLWSLWSRSDSRQRRGESGGFSWKLYISPEFESVPAILGDVIDAISEGDARRFKVGSRDLAGLLRPDKIVAYFESEESLRRAAEALATRLAGVEPHGVPFTCELAGAGLLSWGIDPPADATGLPWQERESWRLWLTNRLAASLLAARAQPESGVKPWRFALARLEQAGVDTATWTPGDGFWSEADPWRR
jgi:hypothetical protein